MCPLLCRGDLTHIKLSHYKAVVDALFAQKLVVSAHLGAGVLIYYHKAVGTAKGGEPMGNGKGVYWMSLLAMLALERLGNTRVFTSFPRKRVKGYLRSRSSRSRAMLICISPSMRRVESSSWSMRTASCTSAGEPTESEPKLE